MLRALGVLALAWTLASAPAVASPQDTPPPDDPAAALSAVFERVERFESLTIDAGDGVVHLGGTTPSPAVRDEVEALARALPGVLFVDNQIEIVVEQEPEAEEDAEESAPTSVDEQIENRLRGIISQVDEFAGIDVAVEAGVVRLTGETESASASTRAAELASGLDDVVYVDNDLEATSDLSRRLTPALEKLTRTARDVVLGLPLFFVALFVLLAFAWLARRSSRWHLPERWFAERTLLRDQAQRVVWLGILLVGVFLALEILDATAVVGAVLGAAGLVGLAIGFAFRDIIENHLASLLLSVRRPFAVKDVVEIDGTLAKVIRMTTSETLMLTLDGNHVRLPNSHVFKSKIVNYTRNPMRRFEFAVGLGHDVDLDAALALGLDTVRRVPGVLATPEPMALFEELAPSNIAVRFFAWVDQRESDFGKVRSRAVQLVDEVYDEHGVDVSVPVQEVVVRRPTRADDERRRPGRPPTRDAAVTRSAALDADVSTDDVLDAQIDRENAETEDVDLLGG